MDNKIQAKYFWLYTSVVKKMYPKYDAFSDKYDFSIVMHEEISFIN